MNCTSYPSLRVEPSTTLRESRVVSVNTRLDGDPSILKEWSAINTWLLLPQLI